MLGNLPRGRTSLSPRNPGAVDVFTNPIFSATTNPFNTGYAVSGFTYSESNMRVTFATANGTAVAIVPKQAGKWVCEFQIPVGDAASGSLGVSLWGLPGLVGVGNYFSSAGTQYSYASDGSKYAGSTNTAGYGATWVTNDVISMLWDADNGILSFAKNGTTQGTAYSGLSGVFVPASSTLSGTTRSVRIATTLTYTFSNFLQWR